MSTAERARELLDADLFAVLGVARNAGTEEIKKAYLTTVKVFHPDRAPSDELRPAFTKAFARIELAKATLMDPTRRARYAEELARPGERATAEAAFEFAKAAAYLKTNNHEQAALHIKKAVSLAPKNVDYAAFHVAVQATPDATPTKLTELAADLDALVAREPESERALFQRGLVRKRLGKTSQAMADFAKVVELNPSNIEAARELRIHQMRRQEKPTQPDDAGIGGVFRRLFKRGG